MNIDLRNIKYYVQEQFKWLYKDIDQRYIIMSSGRGSGKSTGMAQKTILDTFDKSRGNILVVQSTYAAMKESSFAEIKLWIDTLGLNDYFDTTTSPLLITNVITKQKIIFRGCDNPSKLKSMSGIGTIWLEEADNIREEDFDIIDLSARGKDFNVKIYMTFNPGSPYVWIKKYIDDPETYDVFYHKSFYFDNPFLDEGYLLKLENLKVNDFDRYRRDGLGEFTKKEGLIINSELVEDYTNKYYGSNEYIFNGLDFNNGGSHPQAFVNCSYFIDTNILVINYVAAIPYGIFNEFIETIPNKYKKFVGYADSAAADKIKIANNAGFKFKKADKNNNVCKVEPYIEFMNSLDKIVVKPEAHKFKLEIGVWEYIPVTNNPRKIDDDINDAIRYGLQQILKENYSNEIHSGRKRI